jgi:hypothetical protein
MKFRRFLLLLSVHMAFSQSGMLKAQQSLPDEPAQLVASLYRQVIARHPIGIPEEETLKVFSPYLSSSLLHGLAQYSECTSDWDRKNVGSGLKSPVGLFENDIFSGAYEQSTPQTFHVEKTQLGDDGFLRVYVRLTSVSPPAPPSFWRVAVLVSRERGHLLVDDIVYLKDENRLTDEQLSGYFSRYCEGPRFVGRH